MKWTVSGALRGNRPRDVVRRTTIIGVIAFLTLIDLFGSQALLPLLVTAYNTDVATMGLAVNASAVGMAASGLAVAYFADRIDRRKGIWLSLALLSIPTALLGVAENVTVFMLLRVAQGVCMAAAFTLTLTYLSEECDITAASGAMAAYITGNVASNLFGRLLATGFAEAISLPASFYLFACLNLLGAIMALVLIGAKSERMPERVGPPVEAWKKHFANPKLRSSFAIGFLILFVFVGVFTYVNFELVGPALGVSPALLGLVYFVFVPAMVTTPMAPKVVARFGMRRVFWAASLLAVLGIGLSATTSLVAVLVGLALIGVGTFGAQAATTAFVGRTAQFSHAAANGLYLTSYYVGGLVGAFALGMVYDMAGWVAVAAITAVALLLACVLAVVMVDAKPVAAKDQAAAPAE